MEGVKISDILEWTDGVAENIKFDFPVKGISTDTRNLKNGELFVALEGKRFDGHDFVQEAFRKGAVCAVVRRDFELPERPLIKVKDTLKGLGDIAKGYRRRFNLKVIGITGSDGKTTTKEIVGRVLHSKYNTVISEKSYNNQIGLPLTIFKLSSNTKFCVVEMGMNKKGEIDYLSKIASPSVGIITNIGYAHIGFFKNRKEIAEEKSRLLRNLEENGFKVLNFDSPFFNYLKKVGKNKTFSFGLNDGADYQGYFDKIGEDSFTFRIKNIKEEFRMNFWNPSFIYSGIIGIIIGLKFGIPLIEIKKILSEFKPLEGRSRIIDTGRVKVIDESYNSNPFSLKMAIYHFAKRKEKRKILIVGDMAELGRYSYIFHLNIGRYLNKLPINLILTYGEKSKAIKDGIKEKERVKSFRDISEIFEFLDRNIKDGDIILVKGSRIMGMERIVNYIVEKFSC
ncbi:MAG: hypothetical protein DRP67_03535 [Candidatus Omnitrophota bacterium]|nr:MAG: hypothetical protein DRP67_03535 [Candidatus Omnitrophota bacterium]